MSSRTAKRIAVLMGGLSSEREVSLESGRMCSDALRQEGYTVTEVDAGSDLADRLRDIAPDVAFNALHGQWGEDGCVQGMLEWLKIPYTHSGVMASALAMDKDLTKRFVYANANIRSPEGSLISLADFRERHPMQPPYVLKPVREGSSVGVTIVQEGDEPPEFTADADRSTRFMVEEYIAGKELTVTVYDETGPLTVTEIITDAWYDYEAKYTLGGSRHVLPAEIPSAVFDACMQQAADAHIALGCRGISRTDFRWNERQGLFALETNTQPGMTPTSLSPEQAEHKNIPFGALCRFLTEDASCLR